MPANIPQVIGACTTHGGGPGILEFLNINFVIGGIAVVFYPEHGRTEQVIILYQFDETNSMNFFPSADHFVSSMGVNVLDKVR